MFKSILLFMLLTASVPVFANQAKSTVKVPTNKELRLRAARDFTIDEKYHHEDQVRVSKLLARQETMMARQEKDFSRFEKILNTWERQQKQYQHYLDSLRVK